MSDRIASFASTSNLISQALQLQSDYATANAQVSSGQKSQFYSGIASSTKQIVSLNSQYELLNSYSSSITSATNKINIMQSAISGMSDLLTTVTSQLVSLSSGTNPSSSSALTASQANAWRSQMESLLNTQYAGEYVFGGSITNTPPVNLSAAGYNPTSFSTADTGYYQGNSVVASVRASSDLTVSYGITANNSAFEQVFRALTVVAADPSNVSTLNSALTMIKTASSSIADMGSDVSNKVSILDSEGQIHSATMEHLGNSITSLRDVDTATASASLSQINTQLQASYSALALVLKLNLSSYLR